MNWIKTLNELYADHPYTDNGRVVVSYCRELNAVVVKVLDDYKVIEIDDYTDWGALKKVQETVCEMYDNF
jgi:hypothetical protein